VNPFAVVPIFRGILSRELENFGQQSEVSEESVIIVNLCCFTLEAYNKEYTEVLEATVKKS
jgi:hypothetical protein